MNKQLKQLLLTLAKMSTRDQRWIIEQLPPELQQRFIQLQGPDFLQQAAKFKSVAKMPTQDNGSLAAELPEFCEQLASNAPLFIAIILEQGCFSWQALFFKHYDCIQATLQQLKSIKSATKAHLFNQWQQQFSFEELMGDEHG